MVQKSNQTVPGYENKNLLMMLFDGVNRSAVALTSTDNRK